MTGRWKRRPIGANWGDFGPDDELGRLNLISPEIRRRAVAEVRVGRTFCLSLPLTIPGGTVVHRLRHPLAWPRFSAMQMAVSTTTIRCRVRIRAQRTS
jgi:hypothetical protein